MIDAAALVTDLKQQVLALESDLRKRLTLPEFDEPWRAEYGQAFAAERTGQTWTQWADDRITQAAVSWVLTTVFIRFCEDNRLLAPVWISGPGERRQEALDAQNAYFRRHGEDTDREWLQQAIDYLASTPATTALVGQQAMLHLISPSGNAVTKLLGFWRQRGADGNQVYDFIDPELDTRFLGDLYQDLSEHAKKTYALLQTPEFVEEFILDRALEPALAERPLEGFKMIDPACGSGHFLLGAFDRLLARWDAEAPALGPRDRVQKALDGVWGVDINPFAVIIATFRLTVAALQAINETSLENAVDFSYHVLAGDSLWFSHPQDALIAERPDYAYSTESSEALASALTHGQYDAVVANPPYITVKDKALNARYRERYNYLKGQYQLTAPFMELLFTLAKRGDNGGPSGWVGQITSNGFMKREFGTAVIENLLSKLDLRLIVDTSGAYIPGHGTPTVIIVGRNHSASHQPVRAILGIQGEPGRPNIPSEGFVWSSIVSHFGESGYSDKWLSVTDLSRQMLNRHPWSLSGGAAPKVLEQLELQKRRLKKHVSEIGRTTHTGNDEAFFVPMGSVRTHGLLDDVVPVVLGEDIRDYQLSPTNETIFPYNGKGQSRKPGKPALNYLWRVRRFLETQLDFGQTKQERNLRWFDHSMFFPNRYHQPLGLAFAFVATHNHFVLDRGGKVFNRSAPVIKLPKGASEDDHLELLGVLNSSTACFWLKQNSHNKGSTVDSKGARQTTVSWENFYEFTGTTLKNFSLPAHLPLERARTLDTLAQRLSSQQVRALIAEQTPTHELLSAAETNQASLRAQMIAQQEELDWEVYKLYGLYDESLVLDREPPEIRLGERAFEIVLARKIAAGEEDTAWFDRHGSTPLTEIPDRWPADYRNLVQRRIDVIESDAAIGLLETPEFKRRWSTESFAEQQEKALRDWLLDKVEDKALWFDPQGRPNPQSIGQLADRLGRDETFRSVLELWQGHQNIRISEALKDLLSPEAVPYLAAFRLKDSGMRKFADWQRTWDLQTREDRGEDVGKVPVPPKYTSGDFRKQSYWSARGKLDVPKERFIAYPNGSRETDPTLLLGWAGWTHAQQSLALAMIIQERQAEGTDRETLVPLVAGLTEVQRWVELWHRDIDPDFGISPAEFGEQLIKDHLSNLGLTRDDLAAWRPPAATRGRKTRR